MAKNWLGLSTTKPSVDWRGAQEKDVTDEEILARSGSVTSNLGSLPKDALPISTGGEEVIPNRSGSVTTNMRGNA